MTAKHEITRKFALAYAGASKRDKSRLLDEVCAITGGVGITPGGNSQLLGNHAGWERKPVNPGHENTLTPACRFWRKCGRGLVG